MIAIDYSQLGMAMQQSQANLQNSSLQQANMQQSVGNIAVGTGNTQISAGSSAWWGINTSAIGSSQPPVEVIYTGTSAATLFIGSGGGGGGGVLWSGAWGQLATKTRAALKPDKVFALVKRCFKKQNKETITKQIYAAQALLISAKKNGQTALYEEMSERLARAAKDKQIIEAGFGSYLSREAVTRFSGRTYSATDAQDKVSLTPIENFGRAIPEGASAILKRARDSKLFSSFTVLHAGAAMIKTAAQKIREKDPIIFGTVTGQPDRFYFICDWVDELCHLTLSELLTHDEFTGSLQMAEGELSDEDLKEIEHDAAKRKQLLAETNSRTWLSKEAEAKGLEQKKLNWFARLFV